MSGEQELPKIIRKARIDIHDQAQSIADRVLVIENVQVIPLKALILRPTTPSFTKTLQNVQGYL
jgi:hypothetical protein